MGQLLLLLLLVPSLLATLERDASVDVHRLHTVDLAVATFLRARLEGTTAKAHIIVVLAVILARVHRGSECDLSSRDDNAGEFAILFDLRHILFASLTMLTALKFTSDLGRIARQLATSNACWTSDL